MTDQLQLPPSLDLPPHLSAHKYFFVCTLTVAAWDTLVLSPRAYRLLRTKEWPVLKIAFHFLRLFMPIEFTVAGMFIIAPLSRSRIQLCLSPSRRRILRYQVDSRGMRSSRLLETCQTIDGCLDFTPHASRDVIGLMAMERSPSLKETIHRAFFPVPGSDVDTVLEGLHSIGGLPVILDSYMTRVCRLGSVHIRSMSHRRATVL